MNRSYDKRSWKTNRLSHALQTYDKGYLIFDGDQEHYFTTKNQVKKVFPLLFAPGSNHSYVINIAREKKKKQRVITAQQQKERRITESLEDKLLRKGNFFTQNRHFNSLFRSYA